MLAATTQERAARAATALLVDLTTGRFAWPFRIAESSFRLEPRVNAYSASPLFRPEVAQARKHRLEGEVILAQPVRAHVLAGLLVAVIAMAVLWIVSGTYTRNETARGMLVTNAPSAKVIALRPGLVAELRSRDGSVVRAGQRLGLILVEQPNEQGGSGIGDSLVALDAQTALAEQQAELARQRGAAERDRLAAVIAGLRQQRSDLAGQMALQDELVASASETLQRMAPVLEKGFVSRIEYERRRQLLITARQQLSQLRQQSNALQAEELRYAAEITKVAADAGSELAAARSTVQSLAQQRSSALAQRAYVLTAPIAGRVTALQAAVGRSVEPSAPLMTIVPEGSALHAEIYAPTRAIGFVKPGQEVRLLYDAFPYQRFGSFKGRVIKISRTVMDPRDIAAPLKIEEAVYRIEVALDRQSIDAFGQSLALQPGMTLTANLILDRRSFGDWLLQPIRAVLRRNGG